MTAEERARLRELAREATPGPWYASEVTYDGRTVVDDGRAAWANTIICETPDAQYLRACSPDAILALLADLDALEKEVARLRGEA